MRETQSRRPAAIYLPFPYSSSSLILSASMARP